jgi:Phosphotransferase enzyme family
VRRPSGSWTPTVFALLEHLHSHGLPALPRPLGVDERGREMLTYVPGQTVGAADRPAWVRSDDVLVAAAQWLRRFHDAVRTFRPEAPVWRLSARALRPEEIVCHNDFAPYNLVVGSDPASGGVVLRGVLDWDVAGPGRPIDDVAFAAWGFVLGEGDLPPVEAARRLRLLAGSYGGLTATTVLSAVPVRLRKSIERIRTGAGNGDPGMRRLLDSGAVAGVERALTRLARQAPAVEAELGTG